MINGNRQESVFNQMLGWIADRDFIFYLSFIIYHLEHMAEGGNVVAVVLGGGAGSRLFPLTRDRSKPAVPLGGKYRLIDVPVSNCINSGVTQIFVLTQY